MGKTYKLIAVCCKAIFEGITRLSNRELNAECFGSFIQSDRSGIYNNINLMFCSDFASIYGNSNGERSLIKNRKLGNGLFVIFWENNVANRVMKVTNIIL